MGLTKIGTDGFKDDAVTADKLANAINTERTANTAKVSTTINNNADNRVITGSGTANTLNGESTVVVDANGNLGIGTTSPSGKLNLATGASAACELRLTSNNTGSGAGDRGRISVYSSRNDGTAFEAGKIEIDRESGTEDKARLQFFTNGGSGNTERMRIDSNGYVTKPNNPIFHAFGGPNNVAANNDIVFGQERFDVGSGYNTSTGEYTAPATGYYHFYGQVYRQTDEGDSHWGFYLDNGSGYSQISESRMQNSYGGDSGRGYATLQLSIYWYMTSGHKIKCRVNNSSGDIHCNNTLSYFCGNLVG